MESAESLPDDVRKVLAALFAQQELVKTGLHDQVAAAEKRAAEAEETGRVALRMLADLEKETDVRKLPRVIEALELLGKWVNSVGPVLADLMTDTSNARYDQWALEGRQYVVEIYLLSEGFAPPEVRTRMRTELISVYSGFRKIQRAKTLEEKQAAFQDFDALTDRVLQPLWDFVESVRTTPRPNSLHSP